MSRKCRSQFKRVKKKNFSRSFNNSAPYRWETVTGAEGSSRRDGGNIECWLMSVNSQDVEDKHLDKKQTVLGEKDTGNEKKKKSVAGGKLQKQTHRRRGFQWDIITMHGRLSDLWLPCQILVLNSEFKDRYCCRDTGCVFRKATSSNLQTSLSNNCGTVELPAWNFLPSSNPDSKPTC